MNPVTRDPAGGFVTALSPLRERRLLQMAWHQTCDHKRFYSQFRFLQWEGHVRWAMGGAFLTEAGRERLAQLEAQAQ